MTYREFPFTLPSLEIGFLKIPVPMSSDDYDYIMNFLGAAKVALCVPADANCEKPSDMFCGKSRTKEEVMRERRENKGGAGCCELYANMQGCDCLEKAVTNCSECNDSGYAVHPENGWNKNARRCSRGCTVKCSICSDPNCGNPGGQH